MAGGLVHLKVGGQATAGASPDFPVVFGLRDREIAIVRRILWWSDATIRISLAGGDVASHITHDLQLAQGIAAMQAFGSWDQFVFGEDAITSGGGMMVVTQEHIWPDPGFWLGGDQLMTIFNLSPDTLAVRAEIFYERKTISAGEKDGLVARTVQSVHDIR